jgi:hypothetical protein
VIIKGVEIIVPYFDSSLIAAMPLCFAYFFSSGIRRLISSSTMRCVSEKIFAYGGGIM